VSNILITLSISYLKYKNQTLKCSHFYRTVYYLPHNINSKKHFLNQ